MGDVANDLRQADRHFAEAEEDRLGALLVERIENGLGGPDLRTVVEGQHHLLVLQEVVSLVVLEAEAGTARRVDLDDAADAESVGIALAIRRGGKGGARRGERREKGCGGAEHGSRHGVVLGGSGTGFSCRGLLGRHLEPPWQAYSQTRHAARKPLELRRARPWTQRHKGTPAGRITRLTPSNRPASPASVNAALTQIV